jgi:Subtilase family
MKTRIRATAVLGLPAVVICCSLPSVTVADASTVSPLPASDYTVHPVCAAPAPGHAGCLALELVPTTAEAHARTHPLGITRNGPIRAFSPQAGDYGLRPQDLHSVYQLPTTTSSTQTIAIVDAYNDLGAEADLEVYDQEFKLPKCTVASKCFEKVNQKGETGNLPFPQSKASREAREAICSTGIEIEAREAACKEVEEANGWTTEISLDIETAHAVCQNCKIMLVEAKSASFLDLEEGEKTAASLGATEISNSWGGPELGETQAEDNTSSFNHPGIVITAAAGDNGYLDWSAKEGSLKGYADYPASSPHVVAVGGTRLQTPLGSGGAWAGETVWNGDGSGGGGCSVELTAQPWQQSVSDWSSVGCGTHRAVADVSADADPYTGVAIYDSTPESPEATPGWTSLGGTSLASPLVASVFALAGGSHGVKDPAQTLYENLAASPSSLHDVVFGSNGECSKPFNSEGLSGCTPAEEAANSKCSAKLICLAGPGYDGPTGVGTPNGIAAFQPLTEEAKRKLEEQRAEKQAEAQKRKEELEAEAKKRKEKVEAEEKSKSTGGGPAGTSGEESKAPSTTASAGALPTGGSTSLGSPDLAAVLPVLSALTLTRNATAALSRAPQPKAFRVAFAFTLNVAARVRVTLAKLVVTHGRHRWQTLPYSLTITGAPGRDSARLRARGTLAPGRYRLTLAPVHGTARRLIFRVG